MDTCRVSVSLSVMQYHSWSIHFERVRERKKNEVKVGRKFYARRPVVEKMKMILKCIARCAKVWRSPRGHFDWVERDFLKI